MPYTIRKDPGNPKPWRIINLETGQDVGGSTTKSTARRAIRARLAAEHGAKMRGRARFRPR